jgi:hypothetical protein
VNSVVLGTLGLLGLLVLWRSVMVRHGALGFWQVAARMPESLRSRDDLVGPFKLANLGYLLGVAGSSLATSGR